MTQVRKGQGSEYPDMTSLTIFCLARHERKIILDENGRIKMPIGAQGDFLKIMKDK